MLVAVQLLKVNSIALLFSCYITAAKECTLPIDVNVFIGGSQFVVVPIFGVKAHILGTE
jgi:hypothetical protein